MCGYLALSYTISIYIFVFPHIYLKKQEKETISKKKNVSYQKGYLYVSGIILFLHLVTTQIFVFLVIGNEG